MVHTFQLPDMGDTYLEDAVGFILGFEQPAKRAAAEPRATRHVKVGGGDSRRGPATGSTSNVPENCEHPRPIVE